MLRGSSNPAFRSTTPAAPPQTTAGLARGAVATGLGRSFTAIVKTFSTLLPVASVTRILTFS